MVITLAALGLKLLLVPLVTRDEPVLLFFAAVMVSATFGGLGPGLLATALGMAFDAYFFMEPFNHLALNSAHQIVRLAIFVTEGVVVSAICARMKSARVLAEESVAEAHELEGRLLQISEDEQRRIGHDLHDGLSQHLTGIGLLARRLEEVLADGGASPAAAQDASRLCDLAKTAVTLTRDLCRSLSPTLESIGLADALRGLAGHAETIFHISCTFDQTGELPPVDAPSRAHLYRIAQEAISNAVRHGHAHHVWLRLDQSDKGVTLQIMDDGVGMRGGPAIEPSDGLGLKIMRYRARMIGASIDVTPRQGGGTVVTCRYDRGGELSAPNPSGKPWTLRQPLPNPHERGSSWSKTTPSSAKD